MILENMNQVVRVNSELFGQTHFNKQNVNVACSPERLALLFPLSLACYSPCWQCGVRGKGTEKGESSPVGLIRAFVANVSI